MARTPPNETGGAAASPPVMTEQVPGPARFRPVSALLRRHAETAPEKVFLQSVEDGRSLTHAGTLAVCERFAGYFCDRGSRRATESWC